MSHIRTSLGPLLTTVAIVVGLLAGPGCKPRQARPAAATDRPVVAVAHPVVTSVMDWEEATGRLAAVDSVEVRARVGGYLDEIRFKDGQLVGKGDVLFVIDPRPFRAVLAAAEGEAQALSSRLALARNDFERAGRLVDKGAISQEDFDTRAKAADAALASWEAAKAKVERARLDVEFTEVKAPMAGRIARHQVSVGNLISGGSENATVLTNIVTIDPIHCYFDVDERTVIRIRQLIRDGNAKSARESEWPVYLSLNKEDGFPFQGTIDFVDNQVNPKTGTLRLRAALPNPKEALAPGYFGRVRVPVGSPHDALLVSDRAIDNDQGQKIVYVVNDRNEVASRAVRTGQLHDGLREITAGLVSGDRVVVRGIQHVRPGVAVETKLEDMPASQARREAGHSRRPAEPTTHRTTE